MVTVISSKGLSKYPKARLHTAKSELLNNFVKELLIESSKLNPAEGKPNFN